MDLRATNNMRRELPILFRRFEAQHDKILNDAVSVQSCLQRCFRLSVLGTPRRDSSLFEPVTMLILLKMRYSAHRLWAPGVRCRQSTWVLGRAVSQQSRTYNKRSLSTISCANKLCVLRIQSLQGACRAQYGDQLPAQAERLCAEHVPRQCM